MAGADHTINRVLSTIISPPEDRFNKEKEMQNLTPNNAENIPAPLATPLRSIMKKSRTNTSDRRVTFSDMTVEEYGKPKSNISSAQNEFDKISVAPSSFNFTSNFPSTRKLNSYKFMLIVTYIYFSQILIAVNIYARVSCVTNNTGEIFY